MSVGILAYGSLLANPGEEIESVKVEKKADVVTPFSVEFARTSRRRRGAPTLVPVPGDGSRVKASVLVLECSVEDAIDRLYRREVNAVGSGRRYRHSNTLGPDTVVIRRIDGLVGVDVVLYTEIAANIPDLTPLRLAELAIESARGSSDRRDGISYLMDARAHGIETTLSNDYEAEIKRLMRADTLAEAREKACRA